jgi:hypothetical protein
MRVSRRRAIVQEHDLLNRYFNAARFIWQRICAPLAFMIVAPEGGKRPIEDLELIVMLYEQRSTGGPHLAAVRDVHMLECFDHIDEAAGLDSDARTAQHATKNYEVVEKEAHRPSGLRA